MERNDPGTGMDEPYTPPGDDVTSDRGPVASGNVPGADATMGDDEALGETGLEGRNVGLETGLDDDGGDSTLSPFDTDDDVTTAERSDRGF